MNTNAIVEVVRHEFNPDPLNPGAGYSRPVEWRWMGGDVAKVDTFLLDPNRHRRVGDRVQLGPWLVVVVAEELPLSRYLLVTRDLRWAWWYALRFRVADAHLTFKNRVIATCAVWGLGTYEWSCRPQWSNITAVKRVQAWWRQG